MKSIIDSSGAETQIGNVNKQQWHLAILRSGKSTDSRAVWLDYNAGLCCDLYSGFGGHSHQDCMNRISTVHAEGASMSLMPDFGYPPVQFGGWYTERAKWYKSTAAHNTVLINNAEQSDGAGHTTLWADGEGFSAIAASAPNVYPKVATKYDRAVTLVDVSPADFYVLDIFRVIGGHEHAKFFLSHFGQIESSLPMETVAADYSLSTDARFQGAAGIRRPAGRSIGRSRIITNICRQEATCACAIPISRTELMLTPAGSLDCGGLDPTGMKRSGCHASWSGIQAGKDSRRIMSV